MREVSVHKSNRHSRKLCGAGWREPTRLSGSAPRKTWQIDGIFTGSYVTLYKCKKFVFSARRDTEAPPILSQKFVVPKVLSEGAQGRSKRAQVELSLSIYGYFCWSMRSTLSYSDLWRVIVVTKNPGTWVEMLSEQFDWCKMGLKLFGPIVDWYVKYNGSVRLRPIIQENMNRSKIIYKWIGWNHEVFIFFIFFNY